MKSQGWAAALAAVLLAGLSALAVEPDKKDPPPSQNAEGTKAMLASSTGRTAPATGSTCICLPKADAPLPLVIWIHGGGWEAGNKETRPDWGC